MAFFVLVVLLSIPFWIVGSMSGRFLPASVPINLPVGALMAINPCIAAAIREYREGGWDRVKSLLARAVDFRRISRKIWYVPMLYPWPATMVLTYGLMRLLGIPLPNPKIPLAMVPVFALAFMISGAGEELGWQGYAFPRLPRWSALKAGIVLGLVWGTWHVVPLLQAHRAPAWIAGQALGMIPFRILIVWLYNNTGRSVFAVTFAAVLYAPTRFYRGPQGMLSLADTVARHIKPTYWREGGLVGGVSVGAFMAYLAHGCARIATQFGAVVPTT